MTITDRRVNTIQADSMIERTRLEALIMGRGKMVSAKCGQQVLTLPLDAHNWKTWLGIWMLIFK